MQSLEVKAIKNELRNYKYYVDKIKSLEQCIDLCFYNLSTMHGVDPSKEHYSMSPEVELEHRYRIYDEIDKYTYILNTTKAKVKYLDEILNRMELSNSETKKAIWDVYVNGKKTEIVAKELYVSPMGLHKRMNKLIADTMK